MSHCHVKIGKLSDDDAAAVTNEVAQHNFVNQIDLVFPKPVTESAVQATAELQALRADAYLWGGDLKALLSWIASIGEQERARLRAVQLDADVSHVTTVCIARGILSLRITEDLYAQTGFNGKLSQLSRGNKNLHSRMYNVRIPLADLTSATPSKNTARLFWVVEKHPLTAKYCIAGANASALLDALPDATPLSVQARKYDLGLCKEPALLTANGLSSSLLHAVDQDWLQTTLEWLTYVSIGGPQLMPFDHTDSYVSTYSETLESISEEKVVKVTLTGALVSNETIVSAIQCLINANIPWFGVLIYGVKDVNLSYGDSNEHNFVDDGCNDTVLLASGPSDRFCMWNIVDSGDSHQ